MQSKRLKLQKNIGLTAVTCKKIYLRWHTVEEIASLTIEDLTPYWGISSSRATNIITLARQMLEDAVDRKEIESEVVEKVSAKAKLRQEVYEETGELTEETELEDVELIIDPSQKPNFLNGEDRWTKKDGPKKEYVLVEEKIDNFTTKRSRKEVTPSVSRLTGVDICEINGLPSYEECPSHIQLKIRKALEEHDRLNSSPSSRRIITNQDDTSFGVNPTKPTRKVLEARG